MLFKIKRLRLGFVFGLPLLALLLIACVPPAAEPGLEEDPPAPAPTDLDAGTAVVPSLFPRPTVLPSPASPSTLDAVPATLPLYAVARTPIPGDVEAALAWAQSFGLSDAVVEEANEEMIRLLSGDPMSGAYTELTFLRLDYGQAIIFSTGPAVGATPGPTPLPTSAVGEALPPETVTAASLDFVRRHNLLPEPIIAHEFPFQSDYYHVHVAFAPAGFRLTGGGSEPGVTVRLDLDGRVREARIVPANFTPGDSLAVLPLAEVYPPFLRGDLSPTFFYERAQFGQNGPQDFLRYQAGSRPVGEEGDRSELVYAPVPTQPEFLRPAWLITRPKGAGWDHFVEFYLPATGGGSPPRPNPSPTPLAQTGVEPETMSILPPLLADGEDGLLFGNAVVDGITHTVSLDAQTGALRTVFGLTGSLALDTGRNQLYVDKYPYGLTVIDTATGEVLNEIQLPPGRQGAARPQADPATGNVLLFRDQRLLIADPLSPTWQQTVPFIVEGTVCDEPMAEPPAIDQTWFDPEARLLYLTLVDYVCTPWVSFTVIVYDLNSLSEIARYPRVNYLSGAAVDGRFYAKSWFRLGKTYQWAWQHGQPWLPEQDRGEDFVGAFSGFQVDRQRGRLYEMTVNGLQVLDMATMAVLQTAPPPLAGQLAGHDPVSDQLYFVGENGRLLPWSLANLPQP